MATLNTNNFLAFTVDRLNGGGKGGRGSGRGSKELSNRGKRGQEKP